ncbi:ACBP and GOLD 2 domain containing protein [Trichuris trichiura]|uniref:ACBP and GOLD 2 domain containing protein n=1 Tax=Trichuris trichiura TaxID=36087 RepID=A0A077YX89_TRITR|nr:ACBP and GOLD 2 domain containing protein [Trichuris trichiura]
MCAISTEVPLGINQNASYGDLAEKYRWAAKFLKEKEGKAFHLAYDTRVRLAALSKQVSCGPYTAGCEVGFLDRFGHDRNTSWRSLGCMEKEKAMQQFIVELEEICPELSAFYDVEKREQVARLVRLGLHQEPTAEQVREALNRENFEQFSQYAAEQYPNEPDKREALIKQLQNSHFEEYMAQVFNGRTGGPLNSGEEIADSEGQRVTAVSSALDTSQLVVSDANSQERLVAIQPASMWTRRDIREFKEAIKQEENGVIKVGYGETVTVLVRVPTHENGSCIFWEFATDKYDIAFGLLFEWTVSDTSGVSVHVSEMDDEEDEFDDENSSQADLERGYAREPMANKPQVDQIIPVYRRDCYEEVFAGSHVYPGKGVYLLKFDNSYSLWRSKTLYYRVYYSK